MTNKFDCIESDPDDSEPCPKLSTPWLYEYALKNTLGKDDKVQMDTFKQKITKLLYYE